MADIKNFLYAWCGKKKLTPTYDIRAAGNKNRQKFLCEVRIDGHNYIGMGNSTNKKDAQTNAARDFVNYLVRIGEMSAAEVPALGVSAPAGDQPDGGGGGGGAGGGDAGFGSLPSSGPLPPHLVVKAEQGDIILQQFEAFLSLESRSEEFPSFQPMQERLDTFLCGFLRRPYPELWTFCQKLLILSHGQATVERGFSVNKEVETCNMQGDTVVAHRLVCDYVTHHGGVTKIPLTKELLTSVASARSKYRVHLDQERRKKESDEQGKKRKALEDHLEELKKKRKTVQEVSESLARDADRFAEEAEGKAGTQMAQVITKSNALRRSYKEKLAELKNIVEEIAAMGQELR